MSHQTNLHPERLEAAVAWELRGAWATQREVVVVMQGSAGRTADTRDAPADRARVRGYVEHVAPTDAFAKMWDGSGDVHVPIVRVATVRKPSFSEPLDGNPVAPRVREPIYVDYGDQLTFEFEYAHTEKKMRGGHVQLGLQL